MTTWTGDELNKIGTAEELRIASLRRDGTLRTSVIIWVVRIRRRPLCPVRERAHFRLVSRRPGAA